MKRIKTAFELDGLDLIIIFTIVFLVSGWLTPKIIWAVSDTVVPAFYTFKSDLFTAIMGQAYWRDHFLQQQKKRNRP